MSNLESVNGSLTSQHLIYEYISTESIANSFMPSVKVSKVNIVSARHFEVRRFVYTLVALNDVYFEGRKLSAMPGIRETIVEAIKPGQQIVSAPNGGISVQLVYLGRKDIVQGAVLQQNVRSLTLPYTDVMGDDPARARRLHGSVVFTQRPNERAIAAAYYNSGSKRFELVQNPDRRTLLENFQRRFGREVALAS